MFVIDWLLGACGARRSQQPLCGLDERRQVPLYGGGDYCVIGVKVPMGQVVAHTRDVGPRDRRLLGEYLGIDAFTASPISMRRTRTAS